MKKLFILGNWKSNKTLQEALAWKQSFTENTHLDLDTITVIVCPAFHHLSLFEGVTYFSLGVQDLSPFTSGAYTGAISAGMVKDIASYALLGHSERRKHFGETDEIVADKVKQALAVNLRPVVCVSHLDQVKKLKELVPEFTKSGLILYEPLFAIGSGKSDTPENANKTAQEIDNIIPSVPILYGGSVVAENVKGFVTQPYLSGVGVGGASLDPQKFIQLIQAVL